MKLYVNFLFFLLGAYKVTSSHRSDGDNSDCGSCGNACCILEFKFSSSPYLVHQAIVGSLKAGGVDKRYKFINSSDLRSCKYSDGTQYAVQASHLTSHTPSHLDFINMAVISSQSDTTFVKGFSVSGSEGSHCDGGQNYQNLVMFIKGLAQLYAQHAVYGCAKTTI